MMARVAVLGFGFRDREPRFDVVSIDAAHKNIIIGAAPKHHSVVVFPVP